MDHALLQGENHSNCYNSDDKCQITAGLAITLTGKFLPPQMIYQGKTPHCHPKVSYSEDWDVWHSTYHW